MSDSLLNHSWPSFSKRWKKRWSFKRGSDCKPCLREFTDDRSPALEYPTPKSFLPSLIVEDDSFCTSMAEEKEDSSSTELDVPAADLHSSTEDLLSDSALHGTEYYRDLELLSPLTAKTAPDTAAQPEQGSQTVSALRSLEERPRAVSKLSVDVACSNPVSCSVRYGKADCCFLNKGHLCSCAVVPDDGTSTSEHPAETDNELDLQEAQDSFPTLVRSMSTSRRHSWESPLSPVDCRRRFSLDVTELGSDPEQDDVEKRSQSCLQPHVSLQLPKGELGAWSSSRGGTVIKVEIEPLCPDLVASPGLQEVKCVSSGKRLRSKSVPSACETAAAPQIPHSFNTSLPAVEGVEPPALEMLEKDHVSPDHVLIVQKVLQELKHYHGVKQGACVQEGSNSSQQNLTWFEFLSNENEDSGKSDKAEKGTKVMRRLSSLRSRVTGSWQKDKGKNKDQPKEREKEKEAKETKERNLFAPGYTETHYSRAGQAQSIPLTHTDHCFYHGVVRGWEHSSVTLSTCRGLRGLIVLSSNSSYVLEPAPNSPNQHLIYRVDNLRLKRGACGYQGTGDADKDWLRNFTAGMKPPGQRVKRDTLQATKYVELLLVADYAEFQKHRFSIEATKLKLVEAANYVDKFYRALNIRIALVGLEIWNYGNKCDVTENPYSTLKSFLAWSSKERLHRKHDNAQLITGVPFKGTTVGLAPVMAMCSDFQSGGVNMDHSDNAIGVAATIAHEMGHNFGMNHDSAGCCTTPAADGGCIMASATGHPFPKVFNQCNRQELEKYLQSGGGMCLSNMPDTKSMYGGGKCGNGYLEEGEECDCGEVEECRNPCCDPRTCSLKPGAECAHGSCCHQCKLMSPGTLCRESSGLCDLAEYCTGESPFCPLNSYQIDGAPCDGGRAYCYSGMCLTYRDQCVQLWGPGAQPAPDACFEKVNAAGDIYGNCGKDMYGNYRKCEMRDAKCGKIQCQSSAFKPLQPNAVPIDTTVNMQRCRGTHVYRSESEEKEMLDPGLVLTGTKCGSHHVCFEGRCQNVSIIFDAESCSKKCHGRGVCNNNKNCHCNQGWAPPFCNKEGTGGSLDSGPPLPEGSSVVMITLAILAPLLVLKGILFLFYYLKCWNKLAICSLKKTPQFSDTSGTGHANPAFKLRTPQQQRKVTGFPEIPPSQQAPGLQINRQQPPSFSGSHSCSVGQPVGPAQPALPKDIPRRTPPSRPAPPAPKPPTSQDISRPRPPQRALPANPIPSRSRGWQGNSSAVPLPPGHTRAPGRLQPVAENSGAWTAGAVNNLKVGQPGSRGHS